MDSSTINVQSEGVLLGWRIVVAVAALGLGLYVTWIVNPLDDRLTRLEKDQTEEQARHRREADTFRETMATLNAHHKEERKELEARIRELEAYRQRHEVHHAADTRQHPPQP